MKWHGAGRERFVMTWWRFGRLSSSARRRGSCELRRRFALPIASEIERLESRQLLSIDSWQPRGPGGGGSLFAPSINPLDPNEIYVSSDMGELFRSADGGASWRDVDFRQLQGGTLSRVQFTADPLVRYVLDATSVNGSEKSIAARSGDGGLTWQHLPDPTTSGDLLTLFVDAAHPARLIVSDYYRMWVSQDSGQTWALKFDASSISWSGLRIGGAFFDGDSVTLGTNLGLLQSSDGGDSFTISSVQVPAGEAILSFAGAKQDGVTRFFAITGESGNVESLLSNGDYYSFRNVYSLEVGQTSWTKFGGSLTFTAPNGDLVNALPMVVSMSPTNVNVAYLAGGSDGAVPSVFKTIDGGQTWSPVLLTRNNENIATGWAGVGGTRSWRFGETAMGFTVSPTDPQRVLITDLGFAYQSTDGGATWQSLNVAPADRNAPGTIINPATATHSSGLDNTSSWGLAWTDPRHVIGAYTDIRGAISGDAGQSWSLGYSGHDLNSMYRAVAAPNGIVYAATASVHDLYETTYLRDSRIDQGTGRVLFSSDHGTTWQTLHDFGHVVSWVALDPNKPNRMYASVVHNQAGKSRDGGIWVSDDIQNGAASKWRKLANPPRTQGHPLTVQVLNDGTLVATYSARRTEPGAAKQFTASSGVFISTTGGKSWQDRTAPAMQFYTKDLIVDPHDASQKTWYTTVWNGWDNAETGGGLYRTTDRGVTWTRLFDDLRVSSAAINPSNPNEMYVTTEFNGLWITRNLRDAQPTFTQDAAFPFRHPQRVVFNPYNSAEVWVTTFGSGLFVGHDSSPAGSIVVDQSSYSVDESVGNVSVTVRRIGGSGAIDVSFRTALGTATAGTDFTSTSGTLSWADGDFSDRTIVVPILNDELPEPAETVFVLLSNPTGGAVLGETYFAGIDIHDDDPPQTIQFSSPTYSVVESGKLASITVTRDGGSAGTMIVDYATADGTAKSGKGRDFTATSGTLTFAPGETTKTISIPILDDKLFEGDESLTVSLSNPRGGATLGTNTLATLTILDQEIGQVVFSDAVVNAVENWGSVTLTVRRDKGNAGPVSISYATRDGTARAGRDYTATTGTLNFADGQTSASINVPLTNTSKVDGSRTLSLSLSRPTGGATLGTQRTISLKIADDEIAAAGVIQFDAANFEQNEGWGVLQATVSRTGGDLGNVTVVVSAVSGTAMSGIDFTPITATITFAEGERFKSIVLSVMDDTEAEPPETINLSLSSPTRGATLGTQSSTTITIIDNDPLPAIDTFFSDSGLGLL